MDGVGIFYEVFGPRSAGRSLVFLPTWSIVHSRIWMAQVPYFARHGFRVLVFDGRGNGRSGRPATGYRTDDFVQDTLSVLDAVGIKTAVLVGISDGAKWGIQMAAEHPGRVSDLVLIGPSARLSGSQRKDLQSFFSEPVDRDGWNKYNAVYWQRDYRGFLEFICSQVISDLIPRNRSRTRSRTSRGPSSISLTRLPSGSRMPSSMSWTARVPTVRWRKPVQPLQRGALRKSSSHSDERYCTIYVVAAAIYVVGH